MNTIFIPLGVRAAAASSSHKSDIYVMDSDGGNITQLTYSEEHAMDPAWSPDGASIAFSGVRGDDFYIVVMDSDGGNQTQLTSNDSCDWEPAWSPDGGRITFSSNRDGDYEIFVMDADGRNQTQLTNNTSKENTDLFPAWCPVE
jgi:Tol biopolymer transport system component